MNMNNTFKELFNPIQAEKELKVRTKVFLAEKTHGYTGVKAVTRKYHLYAAACACFLCVLLGVIGFTSPL